MATYVNDLRLKEITTGDESGTWGTSTNTNLELIAEAFSYGTEVITTNADTHTTTIADGSTDPGRSLYLKYTGTLDSACTITIGPDTVSKVWIIENGTSGSQNIIISQGSGANITIPAGDTKVVYSDGAGAGAAFFDAFAGLKVTDPAQTNITSVGTLTGLTITAATPSIQMTDSDNNADAYIQATDGNLRFYADDSAEAADSIVTFNIDGGEKMRIDSSGFVGIGVTPTHNFNLQGTGAVEARFRSTDGDCSLQISSDTDEGQDSELVFMSGTSGRGSITYDHNTTAASQKMIFKTGDILVSAMTIDGSGNVGIGTAAPAAKLHASGTFGTTLTSGVRLDGIGATTNNVAPIAFYNQSSNWGTQHAANIAAANADGTDGGAYLRFSTSADGNTAPAEAMRINKNGSVLIGTSTTPTYAHKLVVAGSSIPDGIAAIEDDDVSVGLANAILRLTFSQDSECTSGYVIYMTDANNVIGSVTVASGTTVNYNTSSDERLKENIVDASSQLNTIKNIKVREFDWKKGGHHQVGLIAQELQTLIPDVVSLGGDDEAKNPYGVDYGKLTPYIVKAMQEQQTIIESLTARITTLEG
jgi:hypothetical protein